MGLWQPERVASGLLAADIGEPDCVRAVLYTSADNTLKAIDISDKGLSILGTVLSRAITQVHVS